MAFLLELLRILVVGHLVAIAAAAAELVFVAVNMVGFGVYWAALEAEEAHNPWVAAHTAAEFAGTEAAVEDVETEEERLVLAVEVEVLIHSETGLRTFEQSSRRKESQYAGIEMPGVPWAEEAGDENRSSHSVVFVTVVAPSPEAEAVLEAELGSAAVAIAVGLPVLIQRVVLWRIYQTART